MLVDESVNPSEAQFPHLNMRTVPRSGGQRKNWSSVRAGTHLGLTASTPHSAGPFGTVPGTASVGKYLLAASVASWLWHHRYRNRLPAGSRHLAEVGLHRASQTRQTQGSSSPPNQDHMQCQGVLLKKKYDQQHGNQYASSNNGLTLEQASRTETDP